MVRLKNVADSPRGIYALSGLEMFSPGEERDVELAPGERASLGSYFRVVKAESAQETPAKAPEPAKADPAPDAPVPIPADWKALPWQQRRSLASKLTDEPINNGETADRVIAAEVAKREG
jgi:hypothetical protein